MGELIVSPGALKRVPNLEEAFAIIVNGDTASQAIGEEQYVYVRNHSTLSYGLYMATSAIASGDAISSSNLSPVSEGGLNALFDKISYNGVDVSITIPSSGWSSSSPYVYTWTDARVTSRCRVIMDFVKGANNGEIPYLDFEKVSGGVKFTAPKKPTQNISVIIHIINAVEQAITNVNGNDVSTSAVNGAANVEEALAAHENSITSHGQSISSLNSDLEHYYTANGSLKILSSGTDVRDITESGRYYILNGVNTPSGVDNYGFLDVWKYTNSYIRYMFSVVQSHRIFVCYKDGSTYGAWEELALNSKFVPTVTQSTSYTKTDIESFLTSVASNTENGRQKQVIISNGYSTYPFDGGDMYGYINRKAENRYSGILYTTGGNCIYFNKANDWVWDRIALNSNLNRLITIKGYCENLETKTIYIYKDQPIIINVFRNAGGTNNYVKFVFSSNVMVEVERIGFSANDIVPTYQNNILTLKNNINGYVYYAIE